MKKLVTALLFAILATNFGIAQQTENHWCSADEMQKRLFEQNPDLEKHYLNHRLLLNSKMSQKDILGDTIEYVIPVVFHILHEYGTENVSDAQVYDAIRVINEEFNAQDPDSVNLTFPYDTMNANVKITFKLAAKDPYGNCSNGIDHIYSHMTNFGTDAAKLNQWDRTRYLNIWLSDVVGEAGAAAYAYKPAATDGNGFWYDGIISFHNYAGSIGTSNPGREHVLTHEVGHYLSLDHVWGSGNDPTVACGDDGVPDTPLTKGYNNCPVGSYPYGWVDCEDDFISSEDPEDSLFWFTFDSLSTGTMDLTPVPAPQNTTLNDTGVVYTGITANGVGTAPTTGAGTFGFDGWDTGAADGETVYANLTGSLNTAKYFEFTIAPVSGTVLTLDNIKFDIARDTMGPRTFAVRTSEDGFTANLGAVINPINGDLTVEGGDVIFYANDTTSREANATFDLSGIGNTMNTVTIRIYAWNAEDPTGDFILDNVRINGQFGRIEDVNNYMEYSYCNYHFTPDQATFMHNALNEIAGYRNNLWIESTLASTGVDTLTLPQNELTVPLCKPIVDFTTTKHGGSNTIQRITCVGQPLNFYDASYNAVIDSWLWEFTDGANVVQTSTDMDPIMTFANPGFVDVKLTVTNAEGSSTETRNNWIYVSEGYANYYGPQAMDISTHPEWFRVFNPEENYAQFQTSNTNGFNNSKCFKLNNYRDVTGAGYATDDYFYYDRLVGNQDILITPSFDLRHTTNVVVSFKFAYATNATDVNDVTEELRVYYSKNCGDTWLPVIMSVDMSGTITPVGQAITDEELVSGGFAGFSDYTPTTNAEWRTASFNYAAQSTDDNVRFMFKFNASSQSSNLYLDDINVDGTLGLTTDEIASLDVNVYPNPTSNGQALTVTYNAQNNPVEFILKDAQGKIVAQEVVNETNTQVTHTIKGTDNLNAACYFLEVVSGDHKTTRKIIVL